MLSSYIELQLISGDCFVSDVSSYSVCAVSKTHKNFITARLLFCWTFVFISICSVEISSAAPVGLLLKTKTQPVIASEKDLSADKPAFEKLLKPRSVQKILDDLDIVANAGWEDDDFNFTNAFLIRSPLRFSRERMLNYALYKQMSSAIHSLHYDPQTNLIEVLGEAGGFYMHSWIRPDLHLWDEIAYEFVAGDLTGLKIKVYFWEKEGRTLALAKGLLPSGKKRFSKLLSIAFPPVAEIVLGIATKNFRNFIEDDYNKQKGSKK